MTSKRGSFLTSTYGAYHHRNLPPSDDELTRVGPGTPCGEYLRRFWQPVAIADDLKDLPQRIRIMGEDLIVFRDRSGQIGLLELHCSHRGTSLEFGLVSDKGIRCCYHGWLYDVDGAILETPGEPADSTLKDRLCHGAYPVREYKGLVFAYMGPPDKMPAFTIFDSFEVPGRNTYAGSQTNHLPCNWLQVKDNAMDPAHLTFLHTTISGAQVGDEIADDFAQRSEWDFMDTPIGMVYIDSRRIEDKVWVRIADFMPPNVHQFPPSGQLQKTEDFYGRPDTTIWAVPIDDTNTLTFRLWHTREGRQRPQGNTFGQTDERPYEERQRTPGDYDAQVGQRSIAIHGMEHLGVTDRGVIMFRNIIRRGIEAVQRGEDPMGVQREEGEVLPTYTCDTVVEVPRAATPEEDRQVVRQAGRRVAEGYIETPPALVAGIT